MRQIAGQMFVLVLSEIGEIIRTCIFTKRNFQFPEIPESTIIKIVPIVTYLFFTWAALAWRAPAVVMVKMWRIILLLLVIVIQIN